MAQNDPIDKVDYTWDDAIRTEQERTDKMISERRDEVKMTWSDGSDPVNTRSDEEIRNAKS